MLEHGDASGGAVALQGTSQKCFDGRIDHAYRHASTGAGHVHLREAVSSIREIALVWLLFALVAVEIFSTYSRLPAVALYHVSGTGFAAGAGRVVVFLNYPVALAAIPIVLLAADRLEGRLAAAAAGLALVLSAAVFWPGVVDQADLDAKSTNAIAALGVLLALVLTVAAARRPARLRPRPGRSGDRIRIAIAAAALALAVPWIAADLGFSFNGVPVLGTLWQSGEARSQPGVPGLHSAVHHGHHHGMDGVLLVLTALLLSRTLPGVRRNGLRIGAAAFLSLMLAYGSGEIVNDFWLEQVVKRGWTDWAIPDVTRPAVSIAWGIVVLGAIAVYVLWFGPGRAGRQGA